MHAIKIDAYDKKFIGHDLPRRELSNSLVCPLLSPDKHTRNCKDWREEVVLGYHQLVVSKVNSKLAHVVLLDSADRSNAPMWLINGIQRPLYGNGLILRYYSSTDQYLQTDMTFAEIQSMVTFL